MGETTEIAWCDATFNPWIGCQKVSAGCDNCYAETLMDKRYHRVQWGPHGERIRTSESNWKQPARWAKKARAAGTRPKVFCSSLADVFDNKAPKGARQDLAGTIEGTPELDWLLLTKRPENIGDMIDDMGWFRGFPPNVWLGTTCEDQAAYERRWPILARFNVRVRFISYEPAIGALTILDHKEKPDWLICGGESGTNFRPMPMHWAGDVMDECAEHFVPFFMKQMAGLKPIPEEIMVRQFPAPRHPVGQRKDGDQRSPGESA
jgi:protein gp37